MNEFGKPVTKMTSQHNASCGIAAVRENNSAEEIIKNLQTGIGDCNAILDSITTKLDPVLIPDYPIEASSSATSGDTTLQNALLSVKQNLRGLNERLGHLHSRIII